MGNVSKGFFFFKFCSYSTFCLVVFLFSDRLINLAADFCKILVFWISNWILIVSFLLLSKEFSCRHPTIEMTKNFKLKVQCLTFFVFTAYVFWALPRPELSIIPSSSRPSRSGAQPLPHKSLQREYLVWLLSFSLVPDYILGVISPLLSGKET